MVCFISWNTWWPNEVKNILPFVFKNGRKALSPFNSYHDNLQIFYTMMFTYCNVPGNNSPTPVADRHTHENLSGILDIFCLSWRLLRNQSIEAFCNNLHMYHIVLFKNNAASDHIILMCNMWQNELTFSSSQEI